MRQIFTYKTDCDGKVRRVELSSRPIKRDDTRLDKPFHEKVLDAYRTLECEQGSRFNGGEFSKSQIKRIYERVSNG